MASIFIGSLMALGRMMPVLACFPLSGSSVLSGYSNLIEGLAPPAWSLYKLSDSKKALSLPPGGLVPFLTQPHFHHTQHPFFTYVY